MGRFLSIQKSFVNNPESIYEAQEHAVSVLLLVLSFSFLSDNLTDGLCLFLKMVDSFRKRQVVLSGFQKYNKQILTKYIYFFGERFIK